MAVLKVPPQHNQKPKSRKRSRVLTRKRKRLKFCHMNESSDVFCQHRIYIFPRKNRNKSATLVRRNLLETMSGKDVIELTEEQISSIKDRFNSFDIQRNGHIPTLKLGDMMHSLGHRLKQYQLRELEKDIDLDGNGTIEWEEFLPFYAAMLKQKEEEAFYKDIFRMLDKQKKGVIKCEELSDILKSLSKEVDLTKEEIEAMVYETDEDGNGEISFEEFFKLMTTE